MLEKERMERNDLAEGFKEVTGRVQPLYRMQGMILLKDRYFNNFTLRLFSKKNNKIDLKINDNFENEQSRFSLND